MTPVLASFEPAPFRVERIDRETADVVSVSLSGGCPFPFLPGQFNMLYAWGAGEAAISISGDPGSPGTVVHTVRAVGNVTRALCGVRLGDSVLLRGPFGTAWPVAEAAERDVVIVAGGIGLAPLRPAVLALQRRTGGGRVIVVYGARTPGDVLFRSELSMWALHGSVAVIVDRGDEGWRGETGVVTKLLARADFDSRSAMALLCGPEIMMRFCVRELMRRGVAADRIYLSLERNMNCGVGVCGHCQLGPYLVCRDGPVCRYDRVAPFLYVPEL